MKTIKQCPAKFLVLGNLMVALLAVQACGQAPGKDGGPYLTLGAGMNVMSKEYDADPGLRLSAALGYNFNKWTGLELETGLLYNTFKPGAFTSSDYALQVPVLLNFVVRYENESKWVPYIGFGLGGDFQFDQEDSGFDVVYQPMFGVRREIKDRMSVGLGYKYLGFVAGSALNDEQLGNHGIMIDFNWKF
jgi:opacity protein-like surface antigen